MRRACIMMASLCLVWMLFGCGRQPEPSSEDIGTADVTAASSPTSHKDWEDWEIAANGEDTAEALNRVLVELNYKVGQGFDRNIFNDGYVYEDLGRAAIYRTWKWIAPNFNENVVLLYLKDERRFQSMNLGAYQSLRIRFIRQTQDPDILDVFFEEDAAFSFGLTYYAKSFISDLEYSISQDRIVDKFYSPGPGIYGMSVEPYVNYSQQFQDCEVIDGKKAALRFKVLETNGVENYPCGTQIVIPQYFKDGLSGAILLPHVKMNLSPELLQEMSAMEGIRSVAAEPMQTGANQGTRLIVTPKPGYTVSCRFDSEEVEGWESTFYLFAEKVG